MDVTGGRQLKQLAALEAATYCVAFSPDGKRVAAAGADKRISIFDAVTGALQSTIEKHDDHIYQVQFNANSNRVMSCGYSGTVYVWNLADGAALMEVKVCRVAQTACYSKDGSRILVSSADGEVHFVDVPQTAR